VFAGHNGIHSEVWQQDIKLEHGKRYLISAESGTGKSSMCSYIYGYRQDYSGSITFDDVDIRTLTVAQWCDVRQRHIAYLPQDMRLFGELTAMENVELKNRLTGFKSKDEIFDSMVDYVFDNIKAREQEILESEEYSALDKIRLLLSAMPESYRNINFQELYPLSDKYPKVYKKLQRRLETGWEPTFRLLEQGKEEGLIRPDADLKIFKIMMEATLERFFQQDVMKGSGKKYNDYLNEVVDILLNGIKA
jgi:ABC-type sugar transport system ATPase subunit